MVLGGVLVVLAEVAVLAVVVESLWGWVRGVVAAETVLIAVVLVVVIV